MLTDGNNLMNKLEMGYTLTSMNRVLNKRIQCEGINTLYFKYLTAADIQFFFIYIHIYVAGLHILKKEKRKNGTSLSMVVHNVTLKQIQLKEEKNCQRIENEIFIPDKELFLIIII